MVCYGELGVEIGEVGVLDELRATRTIKTKGVGVGGGQEGRPPGDWKHRRGASIYMGLNYVLG